MVYVPADVSTKPLGTSWKVAVGTPYEFVKTRGVATMTSATLMTWTPGSDGGPATASAAPLGLTGSCVSGLPPTPPGSALVGIVNCGCCAGRVGSTCTAVTPGSFVGTLTIPMLPGVGELPGTGVSL